MQLIFIAKLLLAANTTAAVLCAETSYDIKDTSNVMQVMRNRVHAGERFRRLRGAFPSTYYGVVTQKHQFARPAQCRPGWLRKEHVLIAWRGILGAHLSAHPRVKEPRVLSFCNRRTYAKRRIRRKWRKTRLVAHTHRGKRRMTGHVYMKYRKRYLQR